jgi:hypothetical protein
MTLRFFLIEILDNGRPIPLTGLGVFFWSKQGQGGNGAWVIDVAG